MTDAGIFEIFLVAPPGLEAVLCAEAKEQGFLAATSAPGGIIIKGTWTDVWRANLCLRGAIRVLVRIASFRAMHLAQLDKRSRKIAWHKHLKQGCRLRVDAVCRSSRIYHSGAARQRVETALQSQIGAVIEPAAGLVVKVRLDDDLCTLSIDSTGEPLHKRGFKKAVGKAPLRETMAALFLRQAAYRPDMPLVDPMCGSGTFVMEAAEMAAGLAPGRSRDFAFAELTSFDEGDWRRIKDTARTLNRPPTAHFHGFDRDAGAIRMSKANAKRAGILDWTSFSVQSISQLEPPVGKPGLVITNPPYGERIGKDKALEPLYASLGNVFKQRFDGWSLGIVTSDPSLARATGLDLKPTGPPVSHGGQKVRLYICSPRTGARPNRS